MRLEPRVHGGSSPSTSCSYSPECVEKPSEMPHERAKRLSIRRLMAT
jgi:hypothetical protein